MDLGLIFGQLYNFWLGFFPEIKINLLDVIIVVIIIYYAVEGYVLGFVLAFFDLLSFVISFFLALKYYGVVANLLLDYTNINIGFAHALGFFLLAFFGEIVINILIRLTLRFLPVLYSPRRIFKFLGRLNHFFGVLPGVASALIVLAFLLTVIVTLPSSPLVKRLATGSVIGSKLIANTSMFESKLNDVFGGALSETLTYLTVKPDSDEVVNLKFKVEDGVADLEAEEEMLKLVNKEREANGLEALVMNEKLRKLARAQSQDMLKRGYFSHYTLEGLSPFDRMNAAEVNYTYAGENLALAPSVELAMQGFMNSPGHRANILSPNFNKIGIGAIDGGIYGVMFSQEFTD